ncbi:MAG: DUF4038 domain-containing protein [Defluviitaleaceae bacterium]|nr:DUF4038 domain-containing protein [Defluviitaleaceae bacterium]
MMKFEQWRAGLLTFESTAKVENPFLDVTIVAEFTSPTGIVIKREAFWDGGNTYNVSFAPIEIGVWDYVIQSPNETGLNGKSGKVECIPYTGELPIYKHGFLKVGEQGRYLTYADGTPFFWLGDTHWGFVSGEKWDESNHPKMSCMFKGMVDRRWAQKFTVYQSNLRPEKYMGNARYWEEGKEGILPDIGFYQNVVDKRMHYIADKGLVNALGFAWCFSGMDIDIMKNFARYIIARYGALPIVWTLAGEVAGYYPEQREMLINNWREVALLTEKLDGYGHLQTAHYTNERPFPDYYQNENWFDFTLGQAGHGDYVISMRDFYAHRQKFPNKPFIESEGFYEFVHTLEENGGRIATADMLRRVAYLSIQSGGCGYTYGAQGIWDTVWEKPKEMTGIMQVFNPHGITWAEAIDGIGAVQMGYMRDFYEAVEFHKLRPFMACFKSSSFFLGDALFGLFSPAISANDDMSTVVVYVSGNSRINDTFIQYLHGTYRIEWFDPRESKWIVVSDHAMAKDGKLPIPTRPDSQDWLLVFRRFVS